MKIFLQSFVGPSFKGELIIIVNQLQSKVDCIPLGGGIKPKQFNFRHFGEEVEHRWIGLIEHVKPNLRSGIRMPEYHHFRE